ncbi:hypothetical protein CEXT_29051 [Caerostris extrusa]|uniref:Uncharacterized protein n=1 Tax=Caerostris extrusa TaxID=172846 RepID=A0AAV4VNA6_CAEEX|nr:hypothetical protein CEXT_29051 [Caerostris extrusa]
MNRERKRDRDRKERKKGREKKRQRRNNRKITRTKANTGVLGFQFLAFLKTLLLAFSSTGAVARINRSFCFFAWFVCNSAYICESLLP